MPRAMKYTGVRLSEYAVYRGVYDGGQMDRGTLNELIEDLNKRERIAVKRQQKRAEAREKREEQREKERQAKIAKEIADAEMRAEEARKRRNEKRRLQRQLRQKLAKNDVIVDLLYTSPESKLVQEEELDFSTKIADALNNITGNVFVIINVNSSQSYRLVLLRGKDGLAKYFNSIRPLIFFNGSDEGIEFKRLRIVILNPSVIPDDDIIQYYRQNITNTCAFDPIISYYKKMIDNCGSGGSKKRLNQILNSVLKMRDEFPNGIPDEEMERLGKICHRQLIIHNALGGEVRSFNTKSPKKIHFTNMEADHLDEGFICIDKDYERVDDLNEIIKQHEKDGVRMLYAGDCREGDFNAIRSPRGAWAIFNEDYDIYQEFNTSLGINNYSINAVKYPELNNFLLESRVVNSAPIPLCDDPNNLDGVSHIDIKKAYTQSELCGYYQGFLGHIHQFRNIEGQNLDFIKTHLGVYHFKVISCNNSLLNKLGIFTGESYTLPSPEIQWMVDNGLVIQLIEGAWGSSFDIKYTPEMLENRRYCTWAGKLGMEKPDNIYTIKGNLRTATMLKRQLGDDKVIFFQDIGYIVIKVPKKSYYTTHHILAFITSYTRINMLNIMKQIDGELVKVILDGIYYRGSVGEILVPHHLNKDLKTHNFRDHWYYPSEVCGNFPPYNNNLDGNCILAGAGGSGKSFSVLTDKGFNDILYVVPSHLLGRKARENYGCNYTTIHKLIGICEISGVLKKTRAYFEERKSPSVIFIDELTMIEGDWIDKAIQLYTKSLIFVGGDVEGDQWFQCRNGCPGNFSKIWKSNWRQIKYDTDYRAKDDVLKQMKKDIRNEMKRIFTDGGQLDSFRMNLFIKNNYQVMKIEEAVKLFSGGDTWIAGTHKTNKKLLDNGIISGYIDDLKQINKHEGREKRGSFTTHSYQGLTK